MRSPEPLPEQLTNGPFRTRDAKAAGVSRSRTRRSDLVKPFHGVRSPAIASVHDHAAAYATKLPSTQVFGGITAARLWGLPISDAWTSSEPLVIARRKGATRGRAKGTRHIEFDHALLGVTTQHGLPVLTPVSTAFTLARELDHEHLLQIVDALITTSKVFRDLALPRRPHATVEQLRAFLSERTRLRGAAAFAAVLEDARVGADSRFETITRHLIVLAGLPEPVVHPPVAVAGQTLHPDLGYPELKIAIEYEGDGHREAGQWAVDIERYALMEDAGWIVVRITKADLGRQGAQAVARVRAAIARRTR